MVAGSLEELHQLLLDAPLFEYVISYADHSFAVFDTHHDVLVEVLAQPEGHPS